MRGNKSNKFKLIMNSLIKWLLLCKTTMQCKMSYFKACFFLSFKIKLLQIKVSWVQGRTADQLERQSHIRIQNKKVKAFIGNVRRQLPIFQAKLLLFSTLKALTHHNNKYHRKTHEEISDLTLSSEFRH